MNGWQEYVPAGAITLATLIGAWWLSRRVTRPLPAPRFRDPNTGEFLVDAVADVDRAAQEASRVIEAAAKGPPKPKLRKRIRAKLEKLKPSPAQWVGILMLAGWLLLTWGLAEIFSVWIWPLVIGLGLLISAGVLLFTLASEVARRDDQNP